MYFPPSILFTRKTTLPELIKQNSLDLLKSPLLQQQDPCWPMRRGYGRDEWKTGLTPVSGSAGLVGTVLCVNTMTSNIRGKGGRKNHLGGDQSASTHLQQARRLQGWREQHPALVKSAKEAVLGQRCNARQAAKRLTPKSLGAADLQEAAGGDITAAPWQRADIHQN